MDDQTAPSKKPRLASAADADSPPCDASDGVEAPHPELERIDDATGAAGRRKPVPLLCRFEQLCRAMGIVWFPHPAVDMLAVVSALLDDVAADGMPRTRFASRIVPLQRVTAGYTPDVLETATRLIRNGFVADDVDTAAPTAPDAASSSSSVVAAAAPSAGGAGASSAAAADSRAAAPTSAVSGPSSTVATSTSASGPPRQPPLADTSRPTTWAADVSCRNNNSVSKQDILRALSGIVPAAHLLVKDAGKPAAAAAAAAAGSGSGSSAAGGAGAAAAKGNPGPETTVLIEVVGKYAGVSVVRRFRYQTSRRFNVKLLTETEEERNARLATASKPAAAAATAQTATAAAGASSSAAAASTSGASGGTHTEADGGAGSAARADTADAVDAGSDTAAATSAAEPGGPDIALVAEGDWDGIAPREGARGAFLLVCSSSATEAPMSGSTARLEFRFVGTVLDSNVPAVADFGEGKNLAIDIVHTFTPEAARGRGLAQRLTAHALRWALGRGIRCCVPSCSYVSDSFPRRYVPDWGAPAAGSESSPKSFSIGDIIVQAAVDGPAAAAPLWYLTGIAK